MRRRRLLTSARRVLLAGALAVGAHPVPGSAQTLKSVAYGVEITNQSSSVIDQAVVTVFAPADYGGYQEMRQLTASMPHELRRGPHGNQVLVFRFERLPPFASRSIAINAQLAIATAPQATDSGPRSPFLGVSTGLESDYPPIANQARLLVDTDALKTAEQTNAWVGGVVRHVGYVAPLRGARYAWDERQGDCTEFAYLFTALMRANGIPARPIAGFVLTGSGRLRGRDFHNWAEFMAGGQWYQADPQYRRLDEGVSSYVAMRVLVPGQVAGLDNSARYSKSHDDIAVRLN